MAGAGLSAVLLGSMILTVGDRTRVRGTLLAETELVADILSATAYPALVFDDAAAARAALEGLALRPVIARASLYRRMDEPLASWSRESDEPSTVDAPAGGKAYAWDSGRLVLARPILVDAKPVGTLVLEADRSGPGMGTWWTSSVLLFLVLFTGVGLVLTEQVQRWITRPVKRLASAVRAASERRDYAMRVPVESGDEIGRLTVAMNDLFEEMRDRDAALNSTHSELRQRVDELRQEVEERHNVQHALRRSEDTLRRLAFFDPLTDLPNRSLFRDRLESALTQAQRSGVNVAVLFIDVDRFKLVNDSLGHSVGDNLLKEIAKRIQTTIRKSDTLARLGGDEFVVLVPSLAEGEDAGKIAEKILKAIRIPFLLDGQEWYVTMSIGVSVCPLDGSDSETLLKNADAAMYRAKECGRDDYELYSADLHHRAVERVRIENELRAALTHGEFFLCYQPVWDFSKNAIVGAEALIRWNHPERGAIAPLDFIPIAEETGLIVAIGAWALREACAEARSWPQIGGEALRISVNLSGRQFQHASLVEQIESVLEETGLDPSRLELEITESAVMDEVAETGHALAQLKKLGVRLSLDDFGMGYSSLVRLRQFPLDALKIDRSFVEGLGRDGRSAALVEAIVALGRGLGIRTIAEGVETEQQREILRSHGCDGFQGFLFSPPLTSKEFLRLLAPTKSSRASSKKKVAKPSPQPA